MVPGEGLQQLWPYNLGNAQCGQMGGQGSLLAQGKLDLEVGGDLRQWPASMHAHRPTVPRGK